MTGLIERTLRRLDGQLPGRVSRPGDNRYIAATALWAKPIGRMPRAVVHCRTPQDVQSAIRAARDCDLPLSVRGGGHDWAGRALCDGLVIDLSGMNEVVVGTDRRTARISGGARAADVVAMTDPLGLVAVTGSVGAVGMAGLTLGGGYGPLIGRFGLALDNIIAADVVLADGRIVTAEDDREEELFWALHGGGGNFGVVTAMRHRLHDLPNVLSGMLIYPFSEAKAVLERCVDLGASMPEELTVQLGLVAGPDGAPMVFIVPTWCGVPGQGDDQVAPLLKLGTLLDNTLDAVRYGTSLAVFNAYLVNGQRTFMETCWLPALDRRQHRRPHRGHGGCRLARLRHLHPRVQGRGHARTGGGDGLRPSSRPCAGRDSRHVRRSLGPDRGATASPVGPGRSAGVRCDGASRWISEPPRRR